MRNVNLESGILNTSVFLPRMLKNVFGRTLFFGSFVGTRGAHGLSAYAATKRGLEGLV